MTATALVHTALGVAALATGAVVLARPKGGRRHRTVGRVYVGSMLALCLLSFGLRDPARFLWGYGPFHVAAVVSLVSVGAGAWAAWRRRPGWLPHHFMWTAWSYVGLVMATGGHVAGPLHQALVGLGLPVGLAAALAVGAVWGLPPLVGSRMIRRRVPAWEALGARRAPGSVAA